ncbi:hypothetical protein [Guptibacillus hwajinpoensis]|uniref:hypothetical protein n=1 Tax=Guptibacillus hwajinpoensis TaxID=208199 RepID=UPI00273D2590|nr:hypothetical protein [Pseudalkalibacillus hwajinpoensis]WLR59602.1 hypothetical protein LC071_21155 [Pseudalkalibacillus hwajinpoensis]
MYGKVICIQLLIWFAFFQLIYYSPQDHIGFKILLFLVFLYLICTISVQMIRRGRELIYLIPFSTTLALIITYLYHLI